VCARLGVNLLKKWRRSVFEIFLVAVAVGFFAAALAYVVACDRL
jgi:hypothetical protein